MAKQQKSKTNLLVDKNDKKVQEVSLDKFFEGDKNKKDIALKSPSDIRDGMNQNRTDAINNTPEPKFNTAENLLASDEAPYISRAINPARRNLFSYINIYNLTEDNMIVELETFFSIGSRFARNMDEANKLEKEGNLMQSTMTRRALVLKVGPKTPKDVKAGDTIILKGAVSLNKVDSMERPNPFCIIEDLRSSEDVLDKEWIKNFMGDTAIVKMEDVSVHISQKAYNQKEVDAALAR